MGVIEEVILKVVPGGRLVRTWTLTGGIVAETMGVAVEDGAGRLQSFVVRRHESAVYAFRVLKLIEGVGLRAPRAYFLDETLTPPVLVMEMLAGALDFGPVKVADYVGQMAGALARLHGAKLSGVDLSFLKRRDRQCVELGRVRPYLGTYGLVGGLDIGRMEAVLARGLPGEGNAPRLLHGDFWAGNMLWQDGELVGVIDWEDAGLGEPLKDLGEARVELVWLFGLDAVETFMESYRAAVDIDETNLPYWDLCAVLRLLRLTKGDWGWLVDFAGDYGRSDLTAAGIEGAYREFVEGRIASIRPFSRKE